MKSPVWIAEKPRAILLATDLSSRCDRALDRAMFLARQWGARLVVLTVVEPDASRRADASSAHRRMSAYNQIRRDIVSSDADLPVEVVVREGEISEKIREVAAENRCSLIITGTARNELFGRIVLGSTVGRLSRTLALPLLTVRNRVHGPYARIAVASDFSSSSQHALETILGLIPEAQPSVFHAFDVPFLGLMDTQREAVVEQARIDAIAAVEAFVRDAGHPGLPVVVAQGDPAARLREHSSTHDLDLIVVATHGRSALFTILIGSIAQRMLEVSQCDTLLVPEPEARANP